MFPASPEEAARVYAAAVAYRRLVADARQYRGTWWHAATPGAWHRSVSTLAHPRGNPYFGAEAFRAVMGEA